VRIAKLTSDHLAELIPLVRERERIQAALDAINAKIEALDGSDGSVRKPQRKVSVAVRAKMAAAQQRRRAAERADA